VLDDGRIVEFGAPQALLQNKGGLLRALVDESEDHERLYALAGLSMARA
jgi:ABC-type multidrug transport system fused ATPase/permease subunit